MNEVPEKKALPGRPKGRGPSMADVARQAGVSPQTVSRVANGHDNVGAATRERVLGVMKHLGYRPNRAARALRTGRFWSIGVIMFTLGTLGNMKTLDAVANAAAEAGYAITLTLLPNPTTGSVTGAYRQLTEQAVDGVVLIFEAELLDHASLSLPPGLPVVFVDSNADREFTIVDTDQSEGARKATRHLLELGHSTVWHVAGPENAFSALRRREAWRETLESVGAIPPAVEQGDWSAESGYESGLRLAERDDVTAIFAANDQMALGVMRGLHERGKRIPEDVSVVGFDDMDESSQFWPPLTTVHQDFAEVGRLCIEQLLSAIESSAQIPGTTLVPTRLVVRESSGAPSRPHCAPVTCGSIAG